MTLATLKPKLVAINTNCVKVLDIKAGGTERIRGRAWMQTRREVLVAGLYTCVDCGHVAADNEIDHDTPLEQGGANDQSNYRIRCKACHKAKTAHEASTRAGA